MKNIKIQTGSSVIVIDGITQDYPQNDYDLRQAEQHLLNCYSGKIGTVEHLDGYKDMPVIVSFESNRIPFKSFRFRLEEIDKL